MGDHLIQALDGDIRKLKWQLKQANKERGKQGQTIHALRAELALARQKNRQLYERLNEKAYDDWEKGLEQAVALAVETPICEPSKIQGLA